MTSTNTWRWKNGLATWTYVVPAHASENWRANLQRSTNVALDVLEPFARVSDIEIVTAERGDDAFVFGAGEVARVAEAFRSSETIRRVIVTLDLAVNDGTETWLPGAARVFLDSPDQDEDSATDIELWFSLDVDIYAPVTWGDSRDNAVLASINGPRLSGFLQRLRERLGARLVDIDAADYRPQVNADGFAPAG